MSNFTVKNIPTELYQRLKESAQANRRSLNSEIIACIELATGSQPVDVEQFLSARPPIARTDCAVSSDR